MVLLSFLLLFNLFLFFGVLVGWFSLACSLVLVGFFGVGFLGFGLF